MKLRVLIIPDKFKGTLTAHQSSAAIRAGWREARPKDELQIMPMSDGGDGFGQVLSALLGGRPRQVRTVNAAHEPCLGTWWWAAKSRTAIIESANVIGLAQLPKGKFHPFDLDTLGLARVVQAAARAGARTCLIGIGGSATNDGGFGLARGLGWQFLDHTGLEIGTWTRLDRLQEIIPPAGGRLFKECVVAVDVQNPLLGARGCSRIYGPQKGLRPQDYPQADEALGGLARAVKAVQGVDSAKVPGAGAAGGLGFGLLAFLGAKPRGGFDLFARMAHLERALRGMDVVVTGEGSLDRSSLMGKGVGEIARWCQRLKLPCIGLGGRVGDGRALLKVFTKVRGIVPEVAAPEAALAKPGIHLRELARRVADGVGQKLESNS